MQEELNNFKRNKVLSMVPRPKQNVAGTKCVFHNKQDEYEVVTRNKARLVAKVYAQVVGLHFEETFVPVARLEPIQILLAYATHHSFKLFQMDVKNQWTNQGGGVREATPGFEDDMYPNYWSLVLRPGRRPLAEGPKNHLPFARIASDTNMLDPPSRGALCI
jgi:hypothetical protein